MRRYVAFDLGAESGRAVLASLDGGALSIQELHRFPNEPVQAGGTMHWDVLRLWHEMRRGLRSRHRLKVSE
jgi:rhamnulokinase